jgi:hypothetical protein
METISVKRDAFLHHEKFLIVNISIIINLRLNDTKTF